MINLNTFLAILAFTFFVSSAAAQESVSKSIGVDARVLEQLKGTIRSVPNAELNMIGIGEYKTDDDGRCQFEAPVYDYNRNEAYVVIEVKIKDYDVIRPFEGMIQLDTAEARVSMEILVMGRDIEEEYKTQISQLTKKLKSTQRKNSLSVKRMNAMNDSLLVTMQRSAEQKNAFQKSIDELAIKAESEAAQKEAFAEDLARAQKQLEQLEESLRQKEGELYIALEEKYLRQQNIQKAITADLKDYLLRTKDVHDLLQNLDRYFKRGKYPNYTATYNENIAAYNAIFTKINDNYLNYVEGIQRYWDAPLLTREVEDTFEILLDQVHNPKLKPAIMEVNGYIRQNKSGKATKVAHEAFHDLNPLILNLEKAVDRMLSKL